MAERLKLVRDFGELRAGMIVVTKGCSHCAQTHRAMLVRFIPDDRWLKANGAIGAGKSWDWLPIASPCGSVGIGEKLVETGRLYRVEDGLEDTTTTETSHPAPRKRERAR